MDIIDLSEGWINLLGSVDFLHCNVKINNDNCKKHSHQYSLQVLLIFGSKENGEGSKKV